MKVLVTGSAGLLGANFCHYLLKLLPDIQIVGVDNLSGGIVDNMPDSDKFKFIQVDLADKEGQRLVEEDFKASQIDYVFAFAAIACEGLSPYMRQFTFVNNCVINAFLINMAITYRVKRFVYTSSMAVYGNSQPPFTEDLTPNPVDTYGIAKYACELDLRAAYEQHGLEYCIIRPHNVYGIFQNIWDPYRNVLGIWMYQAIHHQPFTIYGDGEQTRSFSYIKDVLPCLWNAAILKSAKNEVVNVGATTHISLKHAALLMAKITGQTDIVHMEPRHEVKHAWSSYQKSIDILGYKETLSLEQGIELMWLWAQDQPQQERKFFKEYELTSQIYSYWQETK